ncbi:hypothetical protein GN956_G27324, partial [Arapaima gigas]
RPVPRDASSAPVSPIPPRIDRAVRLGQADADALPGTERGRAARRSSVRPPLSAEEAPGLKPRSVRGPVPRGPSQGGLRVPLVRF